MTVAKRSQLCALSTPSSSAPAAWITPASGGSVSRTSVEHALEISLDRHIAGGHHDLHVAAAQAVDHGLGRRRGRLPPHQHQMPGALVDQPLRHAQAEATLDLRSPGRFVPGRSVSAPGPRDPPSPRAAPGGARSAPAADRDLIFARRRVELGDQCGHGRARLSWTHPGQRAGSAVPDARARSHGSGPTASPEPGSPLPAAAPPGLRV